MAEGVEAACVRLAIALVNRRRRKRKERSILVKPYLLKRESDGAYHRLVKDLEKEPEEYKLYFRITHDVFLELIEMVKPFIQKNETRMGNAISPAEQLAVTLRFIATGESVLRL